MYSYFKNFLTQQQILAVCGPCALSFTHLV